MGTFWEWVVTEWRYVENQLTSIGITDILDMIFVTIILFYIYRFIRERRAGKLALGMVLLFVMMILSDVFDMHVIRFLLQNIFQVGIIALIVLFQPELRSALEKIGGEPLKNFKNIGGQKNSSVTLSVIREVTDAAADLSASQTGALIVFERTTKLGDISKTGTVLNADVSSFLLKNIFFNKAPMHDGAVVISGGRIHAAGCFLPLSLNEDIIKDLGTRHRAAIGMSENSDAVVLVVSEETGTISIALEGHLVRGYDKNSLCAELERLLLRENIYSRLKSRMKR